MASYRAAAGQGERFGHLGLVLLLPALLLCDEARDLDLPLTRPCRPSSATLRRRTFSTLLAV